MALRGRKGDVFRSVFPTNTSLQPTPDTEFTAPGQPFGGVTPLPSPAVHSPGSTVPSPSPPGDSFGAINDQVAFDRAWSSATRYLAAPFEAGAPALSPNSPLAFAPPPRDFFLAVRNVLWPAVHLPGAAHTDDLVAWYSDQVRGHFMATVLGMLYVLVQSDVGDELLPLAVEVLERAHRLYRHGLLAIAQTLEDHEAGSSKGVVERFRQDLHAIVSSCVPVELLDHMKMVLRVKVHLILQIPSMGNKEESSDSQGNAEKDQVSEKERGNFLAIVERLDAVGLGGPRFQTTFAEVMNDALNDFVDGTYGGVWESVTVHMGDVPGKTAPKLILQDAPAGTGLIPRLTNASPSQCVVELFDWVENNYSRLVVEVFSKLEKTNVAWIDVEKWKEMSIGRLAGLRTQELYDVVIGWPDSKGALEDLRVAVTTPQRRLQLTDVFAANLAQRLLHPGASTLHILRTYISMIWSFHFLDHSKVLLDRVAYPLQLYLCSRDDTVKIIITGLLADTEDASGNPIKPGGDKLVELAILLNKVSEKGDQRADEDLDWNDLDWVPDPVDAGPGYKRSKSADIIGTLIGVLGSQDVFIKEFQSVVAENLLKNEGDFEKEVKLLELLKVRFGEAPLQNCEVMIRDIQDSRRVDKVIRHEQGLDPSKEEIEAAKADPEMTDYDLANPEGYQKPSLHAKILSRLFWPQLQDENFRLPQNIEGLQRKYGKGFEALKSARKLAWLNSLGQASIEIQLEDRLVIEECHTWQATVIDAFADHSDEGLPMYLNKPQWSVQDLTMYLDMDEDLVRSGLAFWVSKIVLKEIKKDVFRVLEVLSKEDLAKSKAKLKPAPAWDLGIEDGPLAAEEDKMTAEKMAMYWLFIQNMLKNAAAQMPLQQIAMMLRTLVVDGFPYSNQELQEFLARKVTAGELELVAGKYKLKK